MTDCVEKYLQFNSVELSYLHKMCSVRVMLRKRMNIQNKRDIYVKIMAVQS